MDITVLVTKTLILALSIFNLNELGDPLYLIKLRSTMVRYIQSHLKKELIKEANSIFYGFIWNGKGKVKHHALIQ